MGRSLAFHGTIVHCQKDGETKILPQSLLIVSQDGCISHLEHGISEPEARLFLSKLEHIGPITNVFLSPSEFLIPGLVDTHNHAPQWAQRGLGGGLHILDWLDQVTFPNEAKFEDQEYARKVYRACVDGFLKQGVTTCSYYGSLHGPATKILADICVEKGQRAFIGKCNMNQNAPHYYRDKDATESLRVTREVIDHIRALDPSGALIKPILTPRFAVCCNDELLVGLGSIAAENPDLPIQTHFNEAQQEIDATLGLFPKFENEADLYDHYGLLKDRSILAHCTIMTDYEIDKLQQAGSGVAHCPVSNTTVGGGFMAAPISKFLDKGIKVGLGTDSGGGFSSSILDAMRQAVIVSNARQAMTRESALSIWQFFYLATLGGAKVCSLDSRIGNFEVGKDFDALVVQTRCDGVMTMIEETDDLEKVFEKFLISGDDRNIAKVYVRGRQLKG